MWFGMGLSVLLVVVFFGFWTNWFGFTAPPPSDGDSAPAGGGFTHSVVGDLVVVGLLGALAATVAWWISRGMRDDAPKSVICPRMNRSDGVRSARSCGRSSRQ